MQNTGCHLGSTHETLADVLVVIGGGIFREKLMYLILNGKYNIG